MIKLYLKQAWMLMKQNKLFTGIYVVGTGLSIALVMTMFIIFYVKFAPIYPEYNRDRTLVMKNMKRYPKGKPDNWNCNGGVAYQVVKDMLPGLPHVEAVGGGLSDFMGDNKVTLPNKELLPVSTYYADAGFWRVFTFRFLGGKPFTKADVEASMPVAVLSEGLAKRLFATADATGRHFLYNGKDFRVTGVVEDVSNATPETAGDLWVPILHAPWMTGIEEGTAGQYLRLYFGGRCRQQRNGTPRSAGRDTQVQPAGQRVRPRHHGAARQLHNEHLPAGCVESTGHDGNCQELLLYLAGVTIHPRLEPQRHDFFAHAPAPLRSGRTQGLWCHPHAADEPGIVREPAAHGDWRHSRFAHFLSDSADGKRLDIDIV